MSGRLFSCLPSRESALAAWQVMSYVSPLQPPALMKPGNRQPASLQTGFEVQSTEIRGRLKGPRGLLAADQRGDEMGWREEGCRLPVQLHVICRNIYMYLVKMYHARDHSGFLSLLFPLIVEPRAHAGKKGWLDGDDFRTLFVPVCVRWCV